MKVSRTSQWLFVLSGALVWVCVVSAAQPPQTNAPEASASAGTPAVRDPNVVGRIGEYTISKVELAAAVLAELRPDPRAYMGRVEPVDAKAVLLKMLAEKATIIDGREQGVHKRAQIRTRVNETRDRRLANGLLSRQLQDKVAVMDDEVEKALEKYPKLDKARARQILERMKANALLDRYFEGLSKKFHVKKHKESFAKSAEIHQRLLAKAGEAGSSGWWIRKTQLDAELTSEEKALILAEYDNGKLTLKDAFDALCDIAPPRRPKDLNTPEGVERFADRAFRLPILVAEAKDQGLDKNPTLVRLIRDYEDQQILREVQTDKTSAIKDPNDDEIHDFFEQNKQAFAQSPSIKVDQIWCETLEKAKAAKAALDDGEDPNSVKKTSLQDDSKPVNLYPAGEGPFWEELVKAEPNQIVGPLKGFFREGVKWRVLKVIEKQPGEPVEYSDDMKSRITSLMWSMRREEILKQSGDELLKKYRYEIFEEKLKGVDPLNIP